MLDPFAGSGTTAAVAKRLGRNFIGFEREMNYVRLARERVEKTEPINSQLLEYRTEQRKSRVPFGSLVEKGYIKPGEFLWSKDRKHRAEVQADASLLYNGKAGSIHVIGAFAAGTEKHNGWDFWYVQRDGILKSIDDLRQDYLNP